MARATSATFLTTALSALLILGFATGCAATGSATTSTTRGSSATDIHPLGAGFLGDVTSPTPEATVTPEAGSWDDVKPPAGYTVVLITAGEDAATATLSDAVTNWARHQSVQLQVLTASNDDEVEARIDQAVALAPDLVVGAGSGIVDVFTLLTGQNLAQQFLIIGAELPEPTENTTAVVWRGASFRGSGLSTADDRDPASVTGSRASKAIAAGVASVLHGLTGIVVRLPS